MLNIIWPLFIVISFIYAFFSGNIEQVSNGIFESLTDVVNLSLTFLGTILKPLIKFLFPELTKNEKAKEEISMNIIANVLGLGNAATPLGLKAMKTMQKENKDKTTLSNSMAMFILINTASIQLIPTNVIAIRNSLNSTAPTQIIFPVWIATIIAAISSIMAAKVFIKMGK